MRSRVGAHHQGRVHVPANENRLRIELPGPVAWVASGEAESRREACLPGQDVLGADRVSRPPHSHQAEPGPSVGVPDQGCEGQGPLGIATGRGRVAVAQDGTVAASRQARGQRSKPFEGEAVALRRWLDSAPSNEGPQREERIDLTIRRNREALVHVLRAVGPAHVDGDADTSGARRGVSLAEAGVSPVGVASPEHDDVRPLPHVAEGCREHAKAFVGGRRGCVARRRRDVEDAAQEIGEARRLALGFDGAIHEAVDQGQPGGREQLRRALDSLVDRSGPLAHAHGFAPGATLSMSRSTRAAPARRAS